MTRVAILHAYSSDNLGDGLLVDAAVQVVRNAFGSDVSITLVASHPESFKDIRCEIVSSKPKRPVEATRYIRLLLSLRKFDLVVGVGGGYLRFGSTSESLKTTVIHVPQLISAAVLARKSVYLPQSVGPLPSFGAAPVRLALSRITTVFARDDKTMRELRSMSNVLRCPDMAIWTQDATSRAEGQKPSATVVLSTRHLEGRLPEPVRELAEIIRPFDGYVQSTVGRNNDVEAVQESRPREILTRETFLGDKIQPRVVVAMRLHAALMAINAGHFVIHLAYERKGFGAYEDLGLSSYVHSASNFEPGVVRDQIDSLVHDADVRQSYSEAVHGSRAKARTRGQAVENALLDVVGRSS